METLISHFKLFVIAFLATGCISTAGPQTQASAHPQAISTAPTSESEATPLSKNSSNVLANSYPPPAEPRIVGPGMLVGPQDEQIDDGGKLAFVVLGTPEGTLTLGVWSSLHPKFASYLKSVPDHYFASTIKVSDKRFVRVIPAKPFAERMLEPGVPEVKPGPGLAYANSEGEVLVSLSEVAPPKGFLIIGQATLDLNSIDVWRTLEEGRKVESAGGLRT